ncbi:MAG: NTP transferase domain-containing protein [Oscillospiraceae bacterium]|nr:NTP transferase domain-containing protein [Oscillospiraceae bacterium]
MKLGKVGGIIAVANPETAVPLLQVGTIPIIQRIVITYQQVGIFPIVVVTGPEEDEIKRQLSSCGVVFITNPDPEQPELMDSVRLGLEYLQNKCDRVAFTPVNVPMFSPATLTELIGTEGDIVTPSYEGRGGHPVLVSCGIIPQLLSYRGSNGLRGAIAACDVPRTWVSVQDKGVVTSVRNKAELMEQLEEHNSAILHPVLHMKLEQESAFFSARLKLLLYLIADTQNMRTACACSGIAHSKAWDMINRLERHLGYSVVERQRGGKAGGSTRLTKQGEAFLVAYHDFEETVHQFTQNEFRKRFIFTKIIE